jgi:hypothetical protein
LKQIPLGVSSSILKIVIEHAKDDVLERPSSFSEILPAEAVWECIGGGKWPVPIDGNVEDAEEECERREVFLLSSFFGHVEVLLQAVSDTLNVYCALAVSA